MGTALLGNHLFRIDPKSVAWPLNIKSAYFDTLGGRVMQVYGVELGDMRVSGEFGVGGWQEQEKFLAKMKEIAAGQYGVNHDPVPLHFIYPEKGWDFTVYLVNYSERGGPSVELTPGNFNPQWNLTLSIVTDNIGLKTVAIDAYLNRLARGLGWKINEFNGPMSFDEVQASIQAAGAANVLDYYRLQFEGVQPPTAAPSPADTPMDGGAGTSTSPSPGPGSEVFVAPAGKSWPAGQLTMDQRADLVLSVGITDPSRAALFVAISQRESSGNSRAHNGNASTGDNSWGLWQINVIDGAMSPQYLKEWRARDLTDPWTNARAMHFLSQGGTNLRPWATNPDGTSSDASRPDLDVRRFLPEAVAAVARVRGR